MPTKKSKVPMPPARRMPKGFDVPSKKKPLPKIEGAKVGVRTPLPASIKRTPAKRKMF
jgi:hypothetical protein